MGSSIRSEKALYSLYFVWYLMRLASIVSASASPFCSRSMSWRYFRIWRSILRCCCKASYWLYFFPPNFTPLVSSSFVFKHKKRRSLLIAFVIYIYQYNPNKYFLSKIALQFCDTHQPADISQARCIYGNSSTSQETMRIY